MASPAGQTAQNQTQPVRGSSLKMAGSSSLKGSTTLGFNELNASNNATFKPAAGTSFALTSGPRAGPPDVIKKPVLSASIIEQEVGGRADPQLGKVAKRIAGMSSVFEEETRARAEQRQLMSDIHVEQITRLDEVAGEVEQSMVKLAQFVVDFKKKTMDTVGFTFDELHGDLNDRFGRLASEEARNKGHGSLEERLASLEARSKTLRAGLEQEKADRIRETTAVLAPLREQIVRLAGDLERERKIRENREVELKDQLKQYVNALDQALDVELEHRKRKHEGAVSDITRDQERLQKRQEEAVEKGRREYVDKLAEELETERSTRISGQDTMAKTLTEFIQAFHTDIKEKASVV